MLMLVCFVVCCYFFIVCFLYAAHSERIKMYKNFEDMFIRFDVIHERDGQTDRQTLHDSKDCAYASHRAVKTIIINCPK